MTNAKTMRRARAVQTDFIRNAGQNVLYFACGTLITRGAVLGDMAPFGASYAASVPKQRLLPSLRHKQNRGRKSATSILFMLQ